MTELRAIMTAVTGLCLLGAACAVFPAVEHIASAVFAALFSLAGLAVAGYLGREVWRELRFRAEMRALDGRDAAHLTAAATGAGGDRR